MPANVAEFSETRLPAPARNQSATAAIANEAMPIANAACHPPRPSRKKQAEGFNSHRGSSRNDSEQNCIFHPILASRPTS